jgi:hypothetical protein
MLKVLHNHIFATKLRDVFASSPLVLVYQTIGTVDAAGAAAALQAKLDAARLPGPGLRVRACRMRNSIAAGAGAPALEQLFQASNLIVGFGPPAGPSPPPPAAAPSTSAAAGAEGGGGAGSSSGLSSSGGSSRGAAAERRAARSDSVQSLLGSLFGPQPGGSGGASSSSSSTSSSGGGPARLGHKELAKAFQLAAALPSEQPLVLLGAFYGRESIQLRHLKEWVSLDEGKVRVFVGGRGGGWGLAFRGWWVRSSGGRVAPPRGLTPARAQCPPAPMLALTARPPNRPPLPPRLLSSLNPPPPGVRRADFGTRWPAAVAAVLRRAAAAAGRGARGRAAARRARRARGARGAGRRRRRGGGHVMRAQEGL